MMGNDINVRTVAPDPIDFDLDPWVQNTFGVKYDTDGNLINRCKRQK